MPEKIKNYLGLDFGTSKIGVAQANRLTRFANPLQTIHYRNEAALWQQLDLLIQQWQIDEFIIGIPVHMDEKHQAMTQYAKNFSQQLEKRYQRPVHHVDERLTSIEAKSIIRQQRQAGKKKKTRKGDIDKIAASLILQQWLDSHE